MKKAHTFKALALSLACLTLLLALDSGCRKKDTQNNKVQVLYLLNPLVKSKFDFKPGTYWIYKDSVSGEIDSAYVSASEIKKVSVGGCSQVDAYKEKMSVSIKFVCVNNSADAARSVNEQWDLSAEKDKMDIFIANQKDTTLPTEYPVGAYLFDYPFKPGNYQHATGCLIEYVDSGYIQDIYHRYTLNGHTYDTTAVSNHKFKFMEQSNWVSSTTVGFFVSSDAGIVKAVFNGPDKPAYYRVLELQRYNIAR